MKVRFLYTARERKLKFVNKIHDFGNVGSNSSKRSQFEFSLTCTRYKYEEPLRKRRLENSPEVKYPIFTAVNIELLEYRFVWFAVDHQ